MSRNDSPAPVAAAGGAISVNPANGESGEFFPWFDEAEREMALAAAESGFRSWSAMALSDRADVLRRVGAYFRTHAERFARTETLEMGKPILQARAEVERCASLCEWYADNGPALIADEPTMVEDEKAYVSFLPLGIILAIMPWNFPLWQIMRGAVPVLLAGNGYLLKHAPNCVRSALNVEEAFSAAGAPADAFKVFNVHQDAVAGVIADRRVAAVTLTGSVRAGASVAAEAGRNIKKTVLELGGCDAFIVLADADIDRAAQAAASARFFNAGQVCTSAKRMIVEASVAEEFTQKLVDAVSKLKVGDPFDETIDVGPMARRDLRDQVSDQVQRTIAEGAKLLLGGSPTGPDGSAFFEPTVLAGVRPGMTAFREEIFGPVAAVIVAQDAEDAIRLANDSDYGLSGAIWSGDVSKAKAMARRLETGGIFINGFAAADPRVPIGGVKKSGYGRELSHFGIREFTNAQIVWRDRV